MEISFGMETIIFDLAKFVFTISFLELILPCLFRVLISISGMVGWQRSVNRFALLFLSGGISSTVPVKF